MKWPYSRHHLMVPGNFYPRLAGSFNTMTILTHHFKLDNGLVLMVSSVSLDVLVSSVLGLVLALGLIKVVVQQ